MVRSLRRAGLESKAIAALTLALLVLIAAAVFLRLPARVVQVGGTLGLFGIYGLALRRARFDGATVIIALSGLALYLGYLGYTEYGERNYDAGDQLAYVRYLVEHRSRPPPAECTVCHHPPLYYAVGALVYAFLDATKLTSVETGLQLLGLVCHLVFVGFAIGTARLLVRSKGELNLATALIVFWPYGIENSVRVHNDSLATTLLGVATYFIVRWTRTAKTRDLYRAALITGFGLLTKSSGYAVALALGILLAERFFRSHDKVRFLGKAVVAGLLVANGLLLNARGKETPPNEGAPLCHKILGTACDIGQHQWAKNTPSSYLTLDLKAFRAEPYALAERGQGRDNFWNHLFKSSLLGTHNTTPDAETSYEPNRTVARIMNGLLLGMDAFVALIAVAFARRRAIRRFWVVLVCVTSAIALMVCFRVLVPSPHHNDFRHIFWIIAVLSATYAAAVGRAQAYHPALGWLGRAMAVVFVGLSIFYFVPKQDWMIRVTRHVVARDLSRYGVPVAAGTPWDVPKNLIIEPNEIVDFGVEGQPTATLLDMTLDGNDIYEVQIIGDDTRTVRLGPTTGKIGVARYEQALDPPVTHVRTIRVRPVSGDYAYSLGHLIIR